MFHSRLRLSPIVAFLALAVGGISAAPASAAIDAPIKINFQTTGAPTPAGYVAETGMQWDTATGRGWVRESTLPQAYHSPISLTARTRDRGTASSPWIPKALQPLLRSFVISEAANPTVRAAFEVAVPNGTYKVTVGMGDSAAFDSKYAANVEGQPIIQPFTPTEAATLEGRFVSGETEVTVNDGRLTLSEVGGFNGKFNYLTIDNGTVDTTAPDAPTALTAVAGTGQVTLSWTASTATDTAGYRVYRATSAGAALADSTLVSGTALVQGTTFNDQSVKNDTRYYYRVVAVDNAGTPGPNVSGPSNEVDALPISPPPAAFGLKVDFTKAGTAAASGYQSDTGLGFDATRGFGHVTQASLATETHVPLDAQSRTRVRTPLNADRRISTFVLTQPAGAAAGAWEAAVPNGKYIVTVGVGDPAAEDSVYRVNAEGVEVGTFTPTSTGRTASLTTPAPVTVADGRLTLDSVGGTNTKLTYVDIAAVSADTEPPTPPSNIRSSADPAGVHLAWATNPEVDLAGYLVYRSISLPVDTTGTPLSGSTPRTTTSYDDATAAANADYYYSIVAVDTSGNRSEASNPVAAKRPPTPVNYKFNFQPSASPAVVGYTVDSGLAYTNARKFGWFRQDSLAGTHVPNAAGATRDRGVVNDQRIDTFVHMQPDGGVPVAWEADVPNGAYDVTFSVGDPLVSPSLHTINVEGQNALDNFLPSATSKWRTASMTVNVTDGRLTLDAIGGTNTKLNYVIIQNADVGTRPSVGAVQPFDGATQVSRTRAVTAELNLPNLGAGIDTATLTSDSVRLERVEDSSSVSVTRNTSAGGDVIVIQPRAQLAANTEYRFVVNSQLKDVSGASFIPKSTSFTTGSSTSSTNTIARFSKTPQSAGEGEMMASLAVGPDNRLYSTTLDGKILRFPIDQATGTLGSPTVITTIIDHENSPRHILGLAFDPTSTAADPILWVTTGHPAFANAPDFSGKLTKLSGPDLSVAEDYVTGLPRSVRDHETNSVQFGPDGKLYITQGSSTATGAADLQWGERPEHLLTAAVLRVDPAGITAPPLDVKTSDGGLYNPFAADAPVTVYASGVRNAYDLVWHSNGELYVPVNGSAANGNTPATPSELPASCNNRLDFGTNGLFTGSVPGLTSIGVQPDLLLRVREHKYYGHPNPSRCEFTFFGGNPTNGTDELEVVNYPVGTQPDRNWDKPIWNFGAHFSPNGAIEYKGSQFNGALNGALLVARYSAGDDIVALPIDPATKNVTDQEDGIPGLGGLIDPLDITEDTRNGNLYVTELGAGRITLLRPDETGGAPRSQLTPSRAVLNAPVGSQSPPQEITIHNSGNAPMRLTGLTLPSGSEFVLDHQPSIPQIIDPDQEVTVEVKLAPTTVGVKSSTLSVTTNDPAEPVRTVKLRGLGTAGLTGANEPSLQRILDTYEIPVNVGDNDPDESTLPQGASLGQEVPIQALKKAGSGKVTVEPIAVFGNEGPGSSVGSFGWNELTNSEELSELGSVPNAYSQSLAPKVNGTTSFDPGDKIFGFWSSWAFFDYRTVFTQDAINTVNGGASHQARGYQLRDASGAVVPNAYIVAFEAVAGTTQDFQDLVMIVRNIEPEGSGTGRISLTNPAQAPFDDRLAFNRIGSLESPPSNSVQDRSKLLLRNTGGTAVQVTSLPVLSGPFEISDAPALPFTIPANGQAEITVRFIATSGRVHKGSMVINSNSPITPSLPVELAGYWQAVSEQGNEPTLAEVVSVMGYGTKITKPGQSLNAKGHVEAVGDEVLSPYWRRIDTNTSVKVTQLSAFHTQGNTASFKWFLKGGERAPSTFLTHSGAYGQSVLPRINGSSGNPAVATFIPPAQFGFGIDGEKSDPKLNNHNADISNGCAEPCGHHIRAWPAKDRSGRLITGSYIMSMDYAGINYDYNDNVYLVSNITPDVEDKPTLFRVDVGNGSPYTDQFGRVWAPDTGLFEPSTAAAETSGVTAIANTASDPLYATYRGNVGNVPLASRELKYRFPVGGATAVDVRLHFAERYWNQANARRFNVFAEGILKLGNVDIWSRAGGLNSAWTMALNDVPVTDGALDLLFKAVSDYPSIAGIEVLCSANCASD